MTRLVVIALAGPEERVSVSIVRTHTFWLLTPASLIHLSFISVRPLRQCLLLSFFFLFFSPPRDPVRTAPRSSAALRFLHASIAALRSRLSAGPSGRRTCSRCSYPLCLSPRSPATLRILSALICAFPSFPALLSPPPPLASLHPHTSPPASTSFPLLLVSLSRSRRSAC